MAALELAVETPEAKWKKPVNFVRNTKAELLMFLFSLGLSMTKDIVPLLIEDKLCYQNYYGNAQWLCLNRNDTSIEEAIQRSTDNYAIYDSIVRQVPGVVFSPFLGNWSDSYGRKLLFLLPLIGGILTNIFYIINVVLTDWPTWMVSVAAIPVGLGGEYVIFTLGLFSYAREAHSINDITLRIGLITASEIAASQIGPQISVILFKNVGYYAVFATAAAIFIADIGLVLWLINKRNFPNVYYLTMTLDLFRIRNLVKCFKTLTIYRPGNRRIYMSLTLVAFIVLDLTFFGKAEVSYSYIKTIIPTWSLVDMSRYNLLCEGCYLLGTIVGMPIMIWGFKLTDTTMAITSIVSQTFYYLVTAYITTKLAFHLVSILSILGLIQLIICRSFIAKCVESYEIGKTMAVFGLIHAFGTNIGPIIGHHIFNLTLSSLHGAVFLYFGATMIIPLIIFAWIHWDQTMINLILANHRVKNNLTEFNNQQLLDAS